MFHLPLASTVTRVPLVGRVSFSNVGAVIANLFEGGKVP
jgi:hypothetical protein